MNRSMTAFCAAIVMFVTATCAMGGQYDDPSGFSLTYPDGWTAVDKVSQTIHPKDLPKEIGNWLQKNQVSLDGVKVMLLRQGKGSFLENLNVVVRPGEPPINSHTVDEVIDVVSKQYRSMGLPIQNMTGRLQTYGVNRAVVLDYNMKVPGSNATITQRQMMIPGGGNIYIITCSAKPETFATYAPIFDSIVSNMKVPAPTVHGFDWNRVMEKALMGGIGGMLIGVGLWAVKKFGARGKQ